MHIIYFCRVCTLLASSWTTIELMIFPRKMSEHENEIWILCWYNFLKYHIDLHDRNRRIPHLCFNSRANVFMNFEFSPIVTHPHRSPRDNPTIYYDGMVAEEKICDMEMSCMYLLVLCLIIFAIASIHKRFICYWAHILPNSFDNLLYQIWEGKQRNLRNDRLMTRLGEVSIIEILFNRACWFWSLKACN